MAELQAVSQDQRDLLLSLHRQAVDIPGAYYTMLLSRAINERMWVLSRQGLVNFIITGEGHEAAQVASTLNLTRGIDWLVPYYRDIASVLVMGITPLDIMLAVFARAADPSSGGRQMPCHFSSRRLHILSGSSPVGTQIPHAVGIAYAAKFRRERSVALVGFGDGATSRGDFHEGLNFAGVHHLPVVFLCQNNSISISVPHDKQVAGGDIAARAKGYGFPGVAVDGTDFLAMYQTTKEAVERARAGEGPTLIEAQVYRFKPHSSNDDDSVYRPKMDSKEQMEHDPILKLERLLEEAQLLTPERIAQLRGQAVSEAEKATREAQESPLPKGEDALTSVYGEEHHAS